MTISMFILATTTGDAIDTTIHPDENSARATLLENYGREIKDWTGEDDLAGMDVDDLDAAICDAGIDWTIEEHTIEPQAFGQAAPDPNPAAGKGHWDTDAELLADWKYEVSNGDTLLGYHQWVSNRDEDSDG